MTNDRRGPRILLAEDALVVGDLVARVLGQAGYHVVGPISTVREALEAARDERLQAAVLDVNLRGATIYPVADLLLARGVPIMFLTGYSAHSLPEAYRQAPYLEKPFTNQALLRHVREFLVPAPAAAENGA